MSTGEVNVFDLSDEEFLKAGAPSFARKEKEEDEEQEQPVDNEEQDVPEEVQEDDHEEESHEEEDNEQAEEESSEEAPEVSSNPTGSETVTDEQKPVEKEVEPIDYEAAYKRIMSFKANGKNIELASLDEALQLMQMGANYTRKMQAIKPQRKIIAMLENNGLLDEGKLSFLIDLEKKNPDAIKKFIKDSGIDPMDIDVTEESSYVPGNHSVTDSEVAFRTVIDDLNSSPEGNSTIQHIVSQWDQASQEALGKSPEILQTIHQHRLNGIYDRISGEVERQKSVGTIPFEMPFVHAYRQVGDQLHAAGAFNDLIQQAPVVKTVARVVHPKAKVANGSKAAAAGTPRSGSKPNKAIPNLLDLNDDEFIKHMANRL